MSASTLAPKSARRRRSEPSSTADLPGGSRAAVYARISLDLRDEAGVERQVGLALERITERSWTVDVDRDVYVDNNISSDGLKRRPAFERLLAAIAAGEYDVVVVFSQDRLTRQTTELERVANACISGDALVESLTGGRLRLDTPEGRLMARTIGNFAQYEREHMGDRLRAEKELKAYAGAWQGGPCPYGYRLDTVDGVKTLVVHEEEAERVRYFVNEIIAGRTLGSLAREMNEQGVPARRGGVWHYSAIRMMVMKPLIAGRRTYHGEDVAEALWPAIVSHSRWLQMMEILSAPERKSKRPRTDYLLTGFVYGVGGDRGRGGAIVISGEVLACYRVEGATVPAELVDGVVVDAILDYTDRRALDLISIAPEDPTIAEVEAIDDRLAALAIEHEDGDLLDVEYRARRKHLMEKRSEVERRKKARVETVSGRTVAAVSEAGSLRALWPDMSNEGRREVIATMVERVVLHDRYADVRVEVVWRPEFRKAGK